ncbi:tagatose 6-phosphate kinase [Kitasatospora gansuensis]|uniref:Tagatose 6-phosphate kinase n=1 Tax=Kitasatospora gansuensis TaxID=258050 RepID=A0A7W7SCP8_9ACTN|nr:1-phosphofructokinase family hexose kinase [Kitasatospora gansuensis]MBB4948055.1 tagatose 6-phosphate kinase [Kitasatospora gansuensis]
MPSQTILTVTLNLALDVTYHLDEVQRFGSNRVREVSAQAGGKGVNVSRTLAALGHDTLVTGLAGGPTGQAATAELTASGLTARLLGIAGESRRTVAVVEQRAGDATSYLEPGPTVTPAEWQSFLALYRSLLADTGVVVLSGSLPAGLPPDAYRTLGELARDRQIPVLLDAEGPALLHGLAAHPTLVKPNQHELAATTGTEDPHEGARRLRALGATSVAASLGPNGLIATTPTGTWHATPPTRVPGNPTGAGDAAVAALAIGLLHGTPWPDRLRQAVALSAATVLTPQAGHFDAETYARLPDLVEISQLT